MNDEDKLFPMMREQCEVMQTSFTEVFNSYDIYIDENIREPSYYRQAFHTIKNAREGDRINLILNNGGGRIDTAICFRNLIAETQAEVLAVLEGDTHSAASMIALSAHGVHVKPYASMMIHHASFGTYNTVQNVMDHVNFTSGQTERLIREVYEHFLTPEELDEVVRNREIWLTDKEIGERLDRMYEARALEAEEEGCDDENCQECSPQEAIDTIIEAAVESGVTKALTSLLDKYTLTEKPKPEKKATKPRAKKAVEVEVMQEVVDTP